MCGATRGRQRLAPGGQAVRPGKHPSGAPGRHMPADGLLGPAESPPPLPPPAPAPSPSCFITSPTGDFLI